MKVDFYRHGLSRADANAVADVLDSPFLTTGKVAHRVEAELCEYFDVPHAILVNSWTSGATATLMALGIGPGDEVIVPAMTFIATANVVEMVGAKTVLVDVHPNTLLLTPEAAAAAVTPRTKAVIPVHLYGQMVDVAALRRAVQARAGRNQQIFILEDCAHCFEGTLNGERPGRYADAACFSFYATKNVTCGEGGAIILRDPDLHGRILETRLHGMTATAVNRFAGGRYNHWDMKRLGIKANLPDLLAALLPAQIRSVDDSLRRRQAVAGRYDEALAGSPFRMLGNVVGCNTASHLYVIGIPSGRRDEAITVLNEAGIGVTVNYRALPGLTYYRDRYPQAGSECPHAMLWGEQTLSLPHYPDLPRDEQDHVVATLLNQIATIA
ncbi:UDP-4-amino-4-deoxy-L-arabinose-oxoglutarate aminotransferase [Mesorhizobium albiziae]|uniref:UDP-4-amino-4-deoxy-L-arabinose-oxoglutarate aminotransferase n=1 Tax=Neomesorhizobium albiziae TaxID=335020 RepID=A0A1I4DZ94_9HYPH|nr:DegT/DnrJ/EryC1/StrS family aminotransferase [Mesorhizobium albiziae]GLS32784.1 UDP-4-amino-4-deoxy-L-arabinose--oxoglutarate aminotransferase [Mesorhizobium albiziae]SFK97191.1 UDP-4-amino-4-deoxy-L-arabinose-oxoglutarate aminotransferase [Mesorhizobium albiziae]